MITRPRAEQLARNHRFAAAAAACDNVGRSRDRQDLYTILAEHLTDLQEGLPPFACKSGCNQCCYDPPLVTSVEWAVMHAHLLTLPADQQEQVVAMAEQLRPFAPDMAEARRQALEATEVRALEVPPMQCPFLVGGLCAIYEARPLVCRGHGQTFRQSGGKRAFYGSYLAFLHLRATFPADVALPDYDGYAAKLNEINEAAGGTEALLPQWLWSHIRDGRLVAETALRPTFA